ncbi:DUF5522 domain-containing protein [Aeoliella sp. ICT_H6.2]|uniref:DUF5522 domain-containing protein n=1 Tax=Aeoliella straminimaris TaxID=2954799 RepID=A0A9X2FB81_9BACT|nr:DUF5522 domain-containing protein [Aeoliella straminimaris]MCO6045782.1 DUF5522 domain-containing protein [Aeoliella straminimaris]
MQRPNTQDDSRDYYIEQGRVVFTAGYLLRRGKCCGSGCRHCPYRQSDSDSAPTATVADGITESREHEPHGGPAVQTSFL